MLVIALFVLVVLGIIIFPMSIPFILTVYAALDGLASRRFINELHVSFGGTNVFFPDLLYAASAVLAVLGVLRMSFSGRQRSQSTLSTAVVLLVVIFFMLFVGKLVNGYFEGMPLDSLVRHFSVDTQCVYMFVPLLFLKQTVTLKKLLYLLVIVSILFPMAQPFLYGSEDQLALEAGQGGTLRLGFGNANLLLMLGVLAFFVWERKIWLSAVPLAGVAMLAQRSAFVALALCVLMLSVIKKKSVKFISLVSVAGVLLVLTLFVIQSTSDVPVVEKAADRLSQTFEKTGTTVARLRVIPMALEEFGKRPWVGFSYRDKYDLQLREASSAMAFNMLHPHNFVLSFLLRTGMMGTLLLFSIITLVLLAALRVMRQKNTREPGMYLLSTLVFFVVFSAMNTTFQSAGYIFWLLAGVTLWYLNQNHVSLQQQRRAVQ